MLECSILGSCATQRLRTVTHGGSDLAVIVALFHWFDLCRVEREGCDYSVCHHARPRRTRARHAATTTRQPIQCRTPQDALQSQTSRRSSLSCKPAHARTTSVYTNLPLLLKPYFSIVLKRHLPSVCCNLPLFKLYNSCSRPSTSMHRPIQKQCQVAVMPIGVDYARPCTMASIATHKSISGHCQGTKRWMIPMHLYVVLLIDYVGDIW